VPVIVGDATVPEVLRQAHAGSARAIVAATSNELANLEVALLAREINPDLRVVVRLADPHLARTFRDAANVRLALSVPSLAAPAFVAALYGDRVQTLLLIGEQLLAVVDLVVQANDLFFQGQAVRGLALDYGLLPMTLQRADQTLVADVMNSILVPGDCLTAIAGLTNLERLMRRERVATGWAVEVTGYPESARPRLVELVAARQGLDALASQQALEQLPARVAADLTRGQAEDLLVRILQQGAAGQVVSMDGKP
jgi:Trk K+ transport system NAD-binding subunit